VRHVLALIDAVHGDSDPEVIPVRLSRGTAGMGLYEYSDRTGRPLRLSVSRHADQPRLTVAHEVGHFLDHQALGSPGRFASVSGRMPAVMDALAGSEAVQTLRARRGHTRVRLLSLDGSVRLHPISSRMVEYLLQPAELFARAYAQFIAVTSGDGPMLQELDEIRRALVSGQVYRRQWNDQDFSVVASAIDRVLTRRGWRR
jgi:hypothetical protein